jgi:hypothetical protein
VDDGQEPGRSLDFVQDHILNLRTSGEEFPESLRTGAHLAMNLGTEQIHHQRSRERLPQPGALSGAPRTEEEATSDRNPQKSI